MSTERLHSSYREALAGLIELLGLVDEESWRSVLQRNLAEWDRARDVRPHLAVYGGIGSFNDVLLTAANGHRVARVQEGWVNECFDALQSACWTAASRIARPGRDAADEAAETSPPPRSTLQGWVCRQCSQRYIDPYWLQFAAARRWTRQAVPEAIASGEGAAVARRAYHFDEDPDCLAHLRELETAVDALGYPAVPDGFSFMDDRCARCGQRDWAVFHWDVLEAPLRLNESLSNLPVPATASRLSDPPSAPIRVTNAPRSRHFPARFRWSVPGSNR